MDRHLQQMYRNMNGVEQKKNKNYDYFECEAEEEIKRYDELRTKLSFKLQVFFSVLLVWFGLAYFSFNRAISAFLKLNF